MLNIELTNHTIEEPIIKWKSKIEQWIDEENNFYDYKKRKNKKKKDEKNRTRDKKMLEL